MKQLNLPPKLIDCIVSKAIIIKYSRLSHDVVSCDVGRDVSTAYYLSSSGDEVGWLRDTF